jgi:hypothetical protein
MPEEELFAGCYWGPREESAEQCARRWLVLLERLAALDVDDQLLGGWQQPQYLPPDLELLVEQQRWEELPDDVEALLIPGPPLPTTLPELSGLVAEGANRDPTLGFNLGAWNGRATQGRVDFSAACGIPAVLVNNACLRLARETDADAWRWARLAEDVLVALVEAWAPDVGYLGTATLREQQEYRHRHPDIGYVTYLSAGRCGSLPGNLEARGRRTRDGGMVFSLIHRDGTLPQARKVIELAGWLRAAGTLAPIPTDRARVGGEPQPIRPSSAGARGSRVRLALQHEPTPANAPLFAADIARSALTISGVELDYSPASLEQVDAILGDLGAGGRPAEEMAETLFGFGCYVGEVMVRHSNGRWDAPGPGGEMDDFVGWPLRVRFPNGGWANPIHSTFKTYRDPQHNSVAYFYRVMTDDLADRETDGQASDDR